MTKKINNTQKTLAPSPPFPPVASRIVARHTFQCCRITVSRLTVSRSRLSLWTSDCGEPWSVEEHNERTGAQETRMIFGLFLKKENSPVKPDQKFVTQPRSSGFNPDRSCPTSEDIPSQSAGLRFRIGKGPAISSPSEAPVKEAVTLGGVVDIQFLIFPFFRIAN